MSGTTKGQHIMEPLTRKCLEERIFEEVQQLLAVGDSTYLQGLSRIGFIEALENELRFLGLYQHDDRETPAVIRAIVEEHADQWRMEYLSQPDTSISSAQPQMPQIPAEVESPWVQKIVSTGSSFQIAKVPRYSDLLYLQGKPITAQDGIV